MMLIPNETRQGITVTGNSFTVQCHLLLIISLHLVKSFVEIVWYLFTIPDVKCFLSGWLSQDSSENFFGCLCQRRKSSENLNSHEFCKNTQALRVINSVCGNIPRGNYRRSKNSIDWEAEPLPKCRKAGLENRPPLLCIITISPYK